MEGDDNFSNEEKESTRVTESRRLKLMSLNEALLCISGTVPSEEIMAVPWKLKLYRLYQILLYLMYMPILVSQLLALDVYKDQLALTLENIGVLVLTFMAYGLHFTVNWSEARNLLFQLETKSVLMNVGTQTNSKKLKIMQENRQTSRSITKKGLICVLSAGIIWICEPFLLKLVDDLVGDKKEEHGSNMGNVTTQTPIKIYPVILWFPFDITTNPAYLIIYSVIVFDVAAVTLKIISNLTFTMSLFIYVATHFRIVVASIEDIQDEDDVPKLQHLRSRSIEKYDFTTKFGYKMSYQDNELLTSLNQTREGTPIMKFKSRDVTGGNDTPDTMTNIKKVDGELNSGFNIIDCFKDCIQLHQSAIRFHIEVNKVISLYFFLLETSGTIAISLGLFQLSLNLGFGTNLKHVFTCFTVIVLGGVAFSYGEDIQTESLHVRETVYNMGWYYHCTKLKRMLLLLITRAQIPCAISIGPINKMTMQHFQEFLNSSYTFFTLLLQFNK